MDNPQLLELEKLELDKIDFELPEVDFEMPYIAIKLPELNIELSTQITTKITN